jgi:hypothetical protein
MRYLGWAERERGREREEIENYCLISTEFQFEK